MSLSYESTGIETTGENKNESPAAIVGVGASAGGLEAFTLLLRSLPNTTGMAFVLVQHLVSSHESLLRQLLARVTGMPVEEAVEGTRILANHVYVIAPNTEIEVRGGVFKVQPRPRPHGYHLPIDVLFRSLAEEQQSNAIGVVLSGEGIDGSDGLREIVTAGGIALVQTPESAEHKSMPRSASGIAAVDYVLPPDEIGQQLALIGQHLNAAEGHPSHWTPADRNAVQKMFSLLASATGVDFSSYKSGTILRRVSRRMAGFKLTSLGDYAEYVENNPPEVSALYSDILIHVTRFFREPDSFTALKDVVFARHFKDRPAGMPYRIWVPGCSTGEEVYSILICLLEYYEEKQIRFPIQVFGTDLCDRVGEKARLGLYTDSIAEHVSAARLERFFEKKPGGYQVKRSVRELCVFAKQNLLKDPPFSQLDLISCRNVLIYLKASLQKQIIPNFHYGLKAGGILFIGQSEGINGGSPLFTQLGSDAKIFVRNEVPSPPLSFIFADKFVVPGKLGSPADGTARQTIDILKEADRFVLNKLAPPGVVINERLEILQFRGDTAPYLQNAPGHVTSNILKMARDGLLLPLQEAIRECTNTSQAVEKRNVRVHWMNKDVDSVLTVTPLRTMASTERFYIVMFDTEGPGRTEAAGNTIQAIEQRSASDSPALRNEMQQLKEHLQSVMQDNQTVIEELQAANEEVLSKNEEFQSINEEIVTAQEELQSTNDELLTMNGELEGRNMDLKILSDRLRKSTDELQKANAYSSSIIETVREPLVVLDSDLCVKTANKAFYRTFGVTPRETERCLLYELGNGQWNIPTLRQLLMETQKSKLSFEDFEISHDFPRIGRKIMLLNGRIIEDQPRNTALILLAIEDVTVRKLIEAKEKDLLTSEKAAREAAEAASREKDHFVATVSHELRTPLTSMAGWTQLLSSSRLNPEQITHGLGVLNRSVKWQKKLIEDLLDTSRIVSGTLRVERIEMSIVTLLETTVEQMRHAAAVKNIVLECKVDQKLGTILGDPERLQQVIGNLISNSIKFTPVDGKVFIDAKALDSSQFSVTIRDTGQGIDAKLLPHIFDRYRKGDDSSRRSTSGLGLGLAIVQELVALHHGSVRAESEGLGKGTTMTVNLPIRLARDSGELKAATPKHVILPPGLRIAVAEDDPDTLELIATILTQHGAEVVSNHTAMAAFELIKIWKPHVLISDIEMPVEDGYDLIKKVRALPKEEGGATPAIALTALTSPADRKKALDAGYQAHVAKPIDTAQLFDEIVRLAKV